MKVIVEKKCFKCLWIYFIQTINLHVKRTLKQYKLQEQQKISIGCKFDATEISFFFEQETLWLYVCWCIYVWVWNLLMIRVMMWWSFRGFCGGVLCISQRNIEVIHRKLRKIEFIGNLVTLCSLFFCWQRLLFNFFPIGMWNSKTKCFLWIWSHKKFDYPSNSREQLKNKSKENKNKKICTKHKVAECTQNKMWFIEKIEIQFHMRLHNLTKLTKNLKRNNPNMPNIAIWQHFIFQKDLFCKVRSLCIIGSSHIHSKKMICCHMATLGSIERKKRTQKHSIKIIDTMNIENNNKIKIESKFLNRWRISHCFNIVACQLFGHVYRKNTMQTVCHVRCL